jgi:hypothetical protein
VSLSEACGIECGLLKSSGQKTSNPRRRFDSCAELSRCDLGEGHSEADITNLRAANAELVQNMIASRGGERDS